MNKQLKNKSYACQRILVYVFLPVDTGNYGTT